jgi:hypothetical protein
MEARTRQLKMRVRGKKLCGHEISLNLKIRHFHQSHDRVDGMIQSLIDTTYIFRARTSITYTSQKTHLYATVWYIHRPRCSAPSVGFE